MKKLKKLKITKLEQLKIEIEKVIKEIEKEPNGSF